MIRWTLIFAMTFIPLSTLLANDLVPQTSNTQERREKLLELIHEEMKTILMVSSKAGPELKYRYFELMAEKLALIHEEDTGLYLKADPATLKQRGGKESFMHNTRKYYQEAKTYGLQIIKSYPRYAKLANIYYTLGLNSRDFGSDKLTEHYLRSALKYAPKRSSIAHLANTSIAEYYYNEKKYKEAETYYSTVLLDNTDKWRPKHYYNMAWCLLKNKKHDRAIEYLYRSYEEGKKKEKVQVKDQVFEALAVFHVIGNRIDEVIDFYLKELDDPTDLLIKTAKASADKGHMKKAERAIHEGLRVARAKNRLNQQMDIHLMQLELYRNYKKEEQFFEVSNLVLKLFKKQNQENKLELDKVAEAIDKIQGLTGYLQIRLTENAKKRVVLKDPKLLSRIISYFDILKQIDEPKKTKYEFYKGETYFSVAQFRQSIESYKLGLGHSLEPAYSKTIPEEDSLDFEKKLFGDNLQRKLMNGYFASLEEIKVSPKLQDDFNRFGFETQLKLWPIDEKSQKIYPRLFGLYLKNSEYLKSEELLKAYHANYPKDLSIQQDLVSLLLDKFIKKKNIDELSRWSFLLEQGLYQYPRAKIETLLTSLGSLLSDNLIQMESAGQTREAALGHGALWESNKYPPVVRGRAAFNASVVFLKMGSINESIDWLKKSFETLPVEKMKENRHTLLSMVARLQNDFYHLEAEYLLSQVNNLYCKEKFKEKNSFHELHLQGLLFQGREKQALDLSFILNQCGLDKRNTLTWQQNAIEQMIKLEKFEEFQKLKTDPRYQTLVTANHESSIKRHLEDKWWFNYSSKIISSPEKSAKNLEVFMQQHFYNDQELSNHVNLLVAFEQKLNQLLDDTKLAAMTDFDPAAFNQLLTETLKKSSQFDELLKTLSIGHSELLTYGVIRGAEYWRLLGDRIENYPISVNDQDFINSFRQQMKGIATTIKNKAVALEKDYHKTMQKNKAVSILWKDKPIRLYKVETGQIAYDQTPIHPLAMDFLKD